jgi:hypothetical protein
VNIRELQIALAIWNAGIARSRREYAEHPTAFGSGGVSSPPRDITCPCGTTFQAAGRARFKFCSDECRLSARRATVKRSTYRHRRAQ